MKKSYQKISIKPKKELFIKSKYISKKRKAKLFKYFFPIIIILLSMLISFIFIFTGTNYKDLYINLKNNNNETDKDCIGLDPIKIFEERLKNGPITICKNENKNSEHVCYFNKNINYYQSFYHKNGVICKMKNIIIDPSKSQQTGIIYKGPVDEINKGWPILSNGFFNMKCNNNPEQLKDIDSLYDRYFNSWNYEYNNENEKIEELSPGKIILFISRNQDSPNLFHGGSEIINVISLMYLFNLNPEKIQVIFLESMTINDDPYYDIYKNIISRGGVPIYIKNLKKKYFISSGIHIPLNVDSPCYIHLDYFPKCEYSSKAYQLYNNLIDEYMKIPKFKDSFISDNETFYYPKSIIDSHELKMKFNKTLTIQWRKVWPKGRTNQYRLLGNGNELADKLASILPKNILIRLVDTASLPIKKQIAIMRKTDYFLGIHGAGFSLSVFMPIKSIVHEIAPGLQVKEPLIMSALSGHKTYSDILYPETKRIENNEYMFFNFDDICNKVLNHMKDNNFI